MKKFSIEYAHIYTNEETNKERDFEIEILNKIFSEIKKEDSVLMAMVDDYSFPDPSFDYSDYVKNLEKTGHKLDFIFRESQLIEDCDKTIQLIKDIELQTEIVEYIKSKKKYPCSLFIATWYLIRLGKIKSKLYPDNLVAEKLINILPESYRPLEEKGLKIIASTEFIDELKNIENEYFEGRKIV